MTTTALERKLSIRQLAEQWGMTVDQIYRLVRHRDPKRRLPHVVIGRDIRFNPSELDAWQQAQRGHRLTVEPRASVLENGASGIPRRSRYR